MPSSPSAASTTDGFPEVWAPGFPHRRQPLRFLISAGEVSGDRYGAGLVAALQAAAACGGRAIEIRALGGPRMAAAGAQLIADTAARAAVGFVEPLRYLIPGLGTALRVRRLVRRWRPHAAVLIDYPGFNIPLAGLLKGAGGVPLIYYLPPEECLWGKKGRRRLDRAHLVCSRADLVLTSHGQDTDFYRAQGCRVVRVGHPLVDLALAGALDRVRARSLLAPGHSGPLVAVFPGSRRVELGLLWPLLAEASASMVRARPDLRFLVPLAGEHLRSALGPGLARAEKDHPELAGRLSLVSASVDGVGPADLAMAAADLAITKAGSVTLELGLRGVPQVMVYRVDRATEWIGRHWLGLSERDFPHMALPNFILGETLVPEFKQHAADPGAIARLALALLDADSPARSDQLRGYARLREVLGGPGAAPRAAEVVLALMGGEPPAPVNAAPAAWAGLGGDAG